MRILYSLLLLTALMLLPQIAVAAEGSTATQTSQQPSIPPCGTGLRWIVNAGSLKRSQPEFPLDLQQKYFDSACTFLVTGPKVPNEYRSWSAVKTKTITTVTQLGNVVSDPSVEAVLYDPEAWPMTPAEEQADPAGATCRAAPIVHSHNKILIVTPATDLVRALVPGSVANGGRYAAFIKTGIAGQIAKCADVYEIQAQGVEMDASKYREFVAGIAQQARAANPHVVILAGISTNPMGWRVSAKDVFKAVQSVHGMVEGFWLNIPAGGKFCPSCGEPQPRVAVELLQMLSSQ